MIREIKIENFKSIKKADIKLEEMNVLIGKNGAGKTTLISAIKLLKDVASGININDSVNSITPYDKEFFNLGSRLQDANFSVTIQTYDATLYQYSFSVSLGNIFDKDIEDFRTPRIGFLFSKETLARIDGDQEIIIFDRTGNGVYAGAAGGGVEPSPLKVLPFVSVLSVYAQMDAKKVASDISSYSVILADSYGQDNRMAIINSNAINLATIDGLAVSLFMNSEELFKEAVSSIRSIIPGFVAPHITDVTYNNTHKKDEQGTRNYIVSWSDSGREPSFSRLSLSGGNSRVIYLIMSLYNCESKTCFVAEEIENGMHMDRIVKLIDQLRMIMKNRKIQLVFTTHSHSILNELLPKEVIYVESNNQGSVYSRLSETDEYNIIKENLNRTPSNIDIIDSGVLFQ